MCIRDRALRGESAFPKDLLGTMVTEAEAKCTELQQQFEAAQAAYDEGEQVLRSLTAQYDDIISWADMYLSLIHISFPPGTYSV